MATKKQRTRRQKQRRQHSSTGPRPGQQHATHDTSEPALDHVIQQAATWSARDDRATLIAWLAAGPSRFGGPAPVAQTVSRQLAQYVARAMAWGWTSADLGRVVRRKATDAATAYATHPAPTLDHRSATWSIDLDDALRALSVLMTLPPLPDLGSYINASTPSTADDRVLTRVRALLAKAESTEFPEESEALTAKAQQLITQHRLDRAMVDDRDGTAHGAGISARRCWLDDPYLPIKAVLLSTVATANDCRAVSSMEIGFVTVIGAPTDIDVTELLFTSLLIQATRAMTMPSTTAAYGRRGRSAAFRRSFLLAFATRIGARLEEAAESALSEATAHHGAGLLPVLAKRTEQVERAVSELFPGMVTKTFSVSDGAGWAAGTTAADLADISVGRPIPTRGT